MISEEMFGVPVETRDDVPEGWIFVERDGVLEPIAAFEPGDEGDE